LARHAPGTRGRVVAREPAVRIADRDGTGVIMARKGLKFDVPLCLGVLALVGIGMVLIYSSSAPYAELRGRPESFYLAQHVKRVPIGLIAFLVAMAVPYRLWERLAAPMVLFAVGMLAFIFVSG